MALSLGSEERGFEIPLFLGASFELLLGVTTALSLGSEERGFEILLFLGASFELLLGFTTALSRGSVERGLAIELFLGESVEFPLGLTSEFPLGVFVPLGLSPEFPLGLSKFLVPLFSPLLKATSCLVRVLSNSYRLAYPEFLCSNERLGYCLS